MVGEQESGTVGTDARGADPARAEAGAALSIGDLADRTGISSATLRMWEQRHGFPVPERLPSGHRRYTEEHVRQVARVTRRRETGVRLETAIAEIVQTPAQAPPSVYARLRQTNPALPTHRLLKSTLIAMSWAVEDEFCAQAQRPHLYGAFQKQRFYDHSRERWAELAGTAASATVFADFDVDDDAAEPREVALRPGAPMRREWTIVCDADGLPVVLTAWELPGQRATADRHREFEAVWSVNPADVAEAARVCEAVARHSAAGPSVTYATEATGSSRAFAELVDDQSSRKVPAAAEQAAITALYARVVSYVDRIHRS